MIFFMISLAFLNDLGHARTATGVAFLSAGERGYKKTSASPRRKRRKRKNERGASTGAKKQNNRIRSYSRSPGHRPADDKNKRLAEVKRGTARLRGTNNNIS